MTYIDHAGDALTCVNAANESARYENHERAALLMAEAQVHATLALVEQQRIANLIALAVPQEVGPDGVHIRVPSYDEDGAFRFGIADALRIEQP